jgi:hypothetical protein
MQRSPKDILGMGRELKKSRDKLGLNKAGESFIGWVRAEFGMRDNNAYHFIHIAERFGDDVSRYAHLSRNALFELARPTTSDDIVERVIAGDIKPTATAIEAARKAEAISVKEKLQHVEQIAAHHGTELEDSHGQLDTVCTSAKASQDAPKTPQEAPVVVKALEVLPAQEQIAVLEARIAVLTELNHDHEATIAELQTRALAAASDLWV